MVRFSCFSSPNHHQKSKKVQKMDAMMRSDSEEKVRGSASTIAKTDDNNRSNDSTEQLTSPSSHEDCWKSENLNADMGLEDSEECHPRMPIKRSQSFGCIMDKERGSCDGDFSDNNEVEGRLQFNNSHETEEGFPANVNTSNELYGSENFESSYNRHQEHDWVQHFDKISDKVDRESLFSVEGFHQFDTEEHADVYDQSADHGAGSGFLASDMAPALSRSQSVNDLQMDTASSTEDITTGGALGLRSKSFGNLHFPQESCLGRESSAYQVEAEEAHLPSNASGKLSDVQEQDEHLWFRRSDSDDKSTDGYAPHDYGTVADAADRLGSDDAKLESPQHESPSLNLDELNPKDFNVRRIQDWISRIDIESDCIVEEPGECSSSLSSKEPQAEEGTVVPIAKLEAKTHPGMEMAYNYISSLTPASSTAQMSNLGLVAVPFLSAFAGLRVLNLSGNAIVRITAGALPRGLHMLNLSKNNIAIIEGLRDLTRLRVLDLSYNRIIRIGHGLASCSSLKELYLAGNKISEVEGLHRLLKLNILDLRSNKISTAKGLGQLAANYGSLQVINLDGNPAQRNVGDEHLKKHLLSLLPSLTHYNKHSIKATGLKEILDRPPRSAAHHFDRSARSENKLTRRGSHGSSLHKLSHARPSHAVGSSSRHSKSRGPESRHSHLPPIASKSPLHVPEVEKKPLSLVSSTIRRIRSEGNLS